MIPLSALRLRPTQGFLWLSRAFHHQLIVNAHMVSQPNPYADLRVISQSGTSVSLINELASFIGLGRGTVPALDLTDN